MGIGHTKQLRFQKINWKHHHNHGGTLRKKRAGRKARPLSTKQPIHLVFKANKEVLRGGFRTRRRFMLIHFLLKKYAKRFWIRIDQVSIQFDHIHLIVRAPRRAKYLDFFRVVAGQIAQRFDKEGLISFVLGNAAKADVTDTSETPKTTRDLALNRGILEKKAEPLNALKLKLWKFRPFTRVVIGYRAYQRVRDYLLLNDLEAIGKIPYRKERLRGLSVSEWELLQNLT